MAKGRQPSVPRDRHGRRYGAGGITKAVNPNVIALANAANRNGFSAPTEVTGIRSFSLMEAINEATGQRQFNALARDPAMDSMPFGPLNPLVPDPIDPLNDQGRTEPRTWQYMVGWNLPGNGNREVPWQVLNQASLGVGIIRRCIEVRKKHIRNLKWSFSPTEEAVTELYEKDRTKGKMDAERELRERLMPEIRRLTEFWRKPWASNDVAFGQWTNGIVENYLVYDAIVAYPETSWGGDVLGLRLIDPATIKLLVDEYGNRPQPPFPAFQQELYGFPRGEFLASVTRDERGAEVIENGYAASELFYYRENYRTTSPYGLSATEQALVDSRLYLKRQQWMIAEYDDGSTPLTWLETPLPTPGVDGLTLGQARQWMKAFNDKTRGNSGERLRTKVLPNGWKAAQMAGIDERYRPEYDLFLIKLLCSYFGVPITELGFTESAGLGGSSLHQGQADVSGRVGQRPDVAVVGDVINSTSAQFLRMPKEIQFSFTDPVAQNDLESTQVEQIRVNMGSKTINEARDAAGESRLPFPEADMPFVLGGPQGIIFLDGAKAAIEAAVEQTKIQAEATALGTAGKLEMDRAKLDDGKEARREAQDFAREEREASTVKSAEIEAFRNFARKRAVSGKSIARPFVFKHATPDDLPELLHCPPELVDFSGVQADEAWVWSEDDLEKAARVKSGLSWLDWNARHPNKQRDARGRWVKGGGPNLTQGIKEQQAKRAKTGKASTLASVFHEDWRKTRLQDDGSFEPRIKATKDKAWAAARGTDQVDIANTSFDDLPSDWQAENLAAAQVVVAAMEQGMDRQMAGAFIHNEWLARNEWARGGDLDVPFSQLPRAEQDKDLDQFDAAQRLFGELKPSDASRTVGLMEEPEFADDLSLPAFTTRVSNGPIDGKHTVYGTRDGSSTEEVLGRFDSASAAHENAQKISELSERRRAFQGSPEGELAEIKQELERLEGDFGSVAASLRRELKARQAEIKIDLARSRGVTEVPSPQVAMDTARAGIASARLDKLGPVSLNLLDHIGSGLSYLPGFSGTKALGNLVESGPDRGLLRLTDLGQEAHRQLQERIKAGQAKRVTGKGIVAKAAAPDGEAGGADPKAQAPVAEPVPPVVPPPDMRWPGWLLDMVIAAGVAAQLQVAMRAVTTGVTISALLDELWRWAAPGRAQRSPELIVEWLQANSSMGTDLTRAIAMPVRSAHLEGALVGQRSGAAVAQHVLDEGVDMRLITADEAPTVRFELDWGGWEPGHPEAAQLLLRKDGLARLLAESDITVKQIGANRLDELGKIIGKGLKRGASPQEIAKDIAAWGESKANAMRIAVTETNRAQSAAAIAEYRLSGMEEKGWMTAHDQRVCPLCHLNAYELDGSPRIIAIDARFPSGDLYPPGHPWCRCAPIPILPRALRLGKPGAFRGVS